MTNFINQYCLYAFLDCIKIINSPVGKWTVQNESTLQMTMNELFNDKMLQSSNEREITPVLKTQVKRKLFGQSVDLEKNSGNNDIIY